MDQYDPAVASRKHTSIKHKTSFSGSFEAGPLMPPDGDFLAQNINVV